MSHAQERIDYALGFPIGELQRAHSKRQELDVCFSSVGIAYLNSGDRSVTNEKEQNQRLTISY